MCTPQNERVKRSKFELKAHTCLLLASKQDELDDRIPLIREIQKLARYEFAYKDCRAEEEILLKELDWKLSVITPLHILQSLLGMGILFENDKVHLEN